MKLALNTFLNNVISVFFVIAVKGLVLSVSSPLYVFFSLLLIVWPKYFYLMLIVWTVSIILSSSTNHILVSVYYCKFLQNDQNFTLQPVQQQFSAHQRGMQL